MARQIQTDFLRANPGTSFTSSVVQSDRVCWSPPVSPTIKVNFDDVVFKDLREVGIGVVVRDSQGLVLASMLENILLSQSVTDVEALVAMRAVNFAQDLSLPLVIIEGDSEIIIKALCNEDESFSSYGHLIAEAKLSTISFYSFFVSHIHRQCNSIAHDLTRQAKNVSGLMM